MGIQVGLTLEFFFQQVWRKPMPPTVHAIGVLYKRLRQANGIHVEVETYGAALPPQAWGSRSRHSLAALTRRAASPPWKGRWLYALVRDAGPSTLLELGTHLGFGTLYLWAAAPQAQIHTIEASPTLARQAQKHFRLFGAKPHLHIGTFAEVLPTLTGPWDLVYIDGDHRAEALHTYLQLLFPKLSPNGMVVCDDIFWSRAMYKAWQNLAIPLRITRQIIGPFGVLRRCGTA
ncbi:MAG: class I SAM-dependent methyltransferase [Bacteroidia bacterium]|jgi:predicted O-methyltransferase YrrM|nr:class I SAM-dependent methyltransferase [Bacteroidia bacterium]GIV24251.1 MAG: hypothetical protein KatS3mg025_1910 [Bacteroidia bacterium]